MTDDQLDGPGEGVGRVLGTADATPLTFWTAVAPGSYLQLDDVVVTRRELPDREPVTIAGVVTQVRARHEGAQFDSDVFAIADGTLPAQVQEAAEVTTTRVDPEFYVPPTPGAVVHRAEGDARARRCTSTGWSGGSRWGWAATACRSTSTPTSSTAPGARTCRSPASPASRPRRASPRSCSTRCSAPACWAATRSNAKALIFNVKGEDLLFLDHPNSRLDDPTRAAYAKLGLDAGAFPDVRVYAPPRVGDSSGTPDVSSRLTGVDSFYWTLSEFCADRLLPYVFADADDERQQYTMVVHSVAAHLARYAQPADGGVSIDGVRLGSYADLVDHVVEQLNDDETRGEWAGSAVGLGTVNAFARRLIGSKKDLGRLIRGDLASRRPHSINTAESAQVTVVDLHNLPDRAQRFVVGVTLKSEFERKEKAGTAKPLLFVVLDELNKYAPREGSSPIKEVLLDIAERGRSLGVILVGAQQTASEVERRIVTNSAIRVVGRLDPAEASRPEYGFLPPAQRQRALLAKPGTMFVNQPDIPVPLCLEFPFPAWATRVSEAGRAPSETLRSITQAADPFAVVGSGSSDDDIPF